MSGKNAPGLKGFPTPDTATGISSYLLLYFQDKEWAQLALGALKTLTAGYNWYQSGELDPDEAAEAFRLIIQEAPYNKLPSCSLPTGQPLERVNPVTGRIENVDDEGNWQADPSIPATPSRPHSTPEEMRCLGSANAANALKTLYESLTDSWSAGLTTAEAIADFVTVAGIALTAEFAPPVAALIAIGGLLFQVVYAVVEFVGADVWTGNFADLLQCYLYECASVDGSDVVTFDFQCVLDKLAAGTGASLTELRLFGQLYYILSFIGADGLNYASSATAITEADCSGCGTIHCHEWDFTSSAQSWTAFLNPANSHPRAAWVSGSQGWTHSTGYGADSGYCQVNSPAFTSLHCTVVQTLWPAGYEPDSLRYGVRSNDYLGAVYYSVGNPTNVTIDGQTWLQFEVDEDITQLWITGDNTSNNQILRKCRIQYTGSQEFGGDNC